ncbi:MAG TPA: SHOCT domain-containing protein [Rhizobiales bacterium]|nr:hypothetical protein BMS3Bbin10_01929 [bacterium BMS3Bbin10]HDO52823.1 SHOCT domain-containing protein [Hyphomicrobiales bacterium]
MQGPEIGGEQMTMGWWEMYSGPFAMLVVLVVSVAVIVFLTRWMMGNSERKANMRDSALAQLKERLAKGEIDAREFEERKNQLRR